MWLNKDGNALATAQLLAAFITAAATYALWRVTRVLAEATKALVDISAQPFVICTLASSNVDSHGLNLTIENTGNATAFDIVVIASPKLPMVINNEPNDTINVSLLPQAAN